MVIDNQEATINVGTEEPVITSSTTSDNGTPSSNFQFRDTGIILEVKPQINAGGLVTMDVKQEVSNVAGQRAVTMTETQPIIAQREISSKVAVQSGQTLVLGGLIRDETSNNQSGIPGLYKLPIVGPLFGGTNKEFERTELVVLITPTVINNSFEAEQVTNELKERMRGIIPLESPWKTRPLTPSQKEQLKKQNESRKKQSNAG